jgi:D-tyrosyl-tRNA(Tyr) deacylase
MRVLLQRVTDAQVTSQNQMLGQIGRGYVLLLGIGHNDTQATADALAEKIVNLRLFPDDRDRFDRSLLDINGHALVVSQFTLFGDARKGRRPSFTAAAAPQHAEPLCRYFAEKLASLGVTHVATGQFAASMLVQIHNDGPVTLLLDSDQL